MSDSNKAVHSSQYSAHITDKSQLSSYLEFYLCEFHM
jgi:hypothetical protein